MNLFRYIDNYGDYSFDEMEFNEVDNVILSSLSYIDFGGIVSSNWFSSIKLSEAAQVFFDNLVEKEKNIISIRHAIKLFQAIRYTKRYGSLKLYNYIYKEGEAGQFSALTIEIHPKLIYVSFEGTDELVCGWKEDFMFSYMFPTMSQKVAINYVNKHFLFSSKNIILGGHSKGGHLAMVAGMHANFLIRDKIVCIYNNDGPGLLKEEFESKYYKNIENKLIHIVPNHSVIGLLLYHKKDYVVVKSNISGLLAHDFLSWVVDDKQFMRAELDSFNVSFEDCLLEWLDKYDLKDRERFVFSLFDIFKRANVDTLIDIMVSKKIIFDLIIEAKDLETDDRKILIDLFKLVVKCFADDKKEEIMSFFGRK